MIAKRTDEELIKIIDSAPSLIQNAISSPGTVATISAFVGKFNLQIDQIGKIAELNRDMLLGLISPPDFVQALQELGVQKEETRNQILTEINQKIFIPLNEEMRKKLGDPSIKKAEAVVSAQSPRPNFVPPPQMPKTPPPSFSTPVPNASVFAAQTSRSYAPPTNPQTPPPPPAPPTPKPYTPPPPPRVPSAPLPPKTVLPGSNGAPVPMPRPAPKPEQPAPLPPKQYGSDPYREPLA